MIIVLIHWKIKDDDAAEAEFLEQWHRLDPDQDHGGLIAEAVTRETADPPFTALPAAVAGCRNFYTFGFWSSLEVFVARLGPHFNQVYGFEAKERTRHLFEPAGWRRGGADFPGGSCPHTRDGSGTTDAGFPPR